MIPIIIKPNILMLKGVHLDSNIYFLKSGRELLIVDTGTGVFWNRYLSIAQQEGWLENVSRVVIFNTHEHFDHVGGNHVFMKFFKEKEMEVEFASHRDTARTLEGGDDSIILSYHYGRKYEPHPVKFKLEDGDLLSIGDVDLRVIHTPGHTQGSACLYYEDEKIMFSGDTVFFNAYGRTDLPTGDEEELIKSLERLARYEVRLGLPGHGKLIDRWTSNIYRILDHLEGL
ncbi:MBL fold metallo-hydrolase [Pyrococcus sp.]|uniref:MBL fold metallo-hydrolase n=1 Tax=Pyrococcus sp. TaxID=33866 RepID=UPI00258E51A9|nr:MBL fold metallo-hydrolase [Pyrococcus sp.]